MECYNDGDHSGQKKKVYICKDVVATRRVITPPFEKVSGAKCFDGQRRCIRIGVKDKTAEIEKSSERKSLV